MVPKTLLPLLPGRAARLTPPPAVARASACAAALATPAGKAVGHTLRVWIEDTDAYEIVYHANYLRFVERAAHVLLGRDACADAFTQQSAVLGLRRVEGIRYNSAAVLGDLLSVTLVPTRIDDENGTIQLSASITRVSDNTLVWSCASAVLAFTNAQTGGPVRWPLATSGTTGGFRTAELMDVPAVPPPPPLSAAGEEPPVGLSLEVVLEAGEVCAGGRLPLLSALRYFERQRSQAIGGADRLKQLYDQGTSVVMARMGYAALQPPDDESIRSLISLTICSHLTAMCSVQLRAKGTQVVFDQWFNGPASWCGRSRAPAGAGARGGDLPVH
jgi:YbgC/YbaW family acyl-CoA thioester hydrolase